MGRQHATIVGRAGTPSRATYKKVYSSQEKDAGIVRKLKELPEEHCTEVREEERSAKTSERAATLRQYGRASKKNFSEKKKHAAARRTDGNQTSGSASTRKGRGKAVRLKGSVVDSNESMESIESSR